VRAYVCVSGFVCVWLLVVCMITVGVLVFVEFCEWLFLHDFIILLHTSGQTKDLMKKNALTLSPLLTTLMPCNSASHSDASCLIPRKHLQ